MLRHLPPTATPLPPAVMARAVTANQNEDQQFRRAFADYVGVHCCLTADSGRTALFLLLTALAADAPHRRDVLLPAYTCPSLVTVIQEAELLPVLVDLDPATLEVDPTGFAQALGHNTLAVIHVHPFGIPQPLAECRRAAHEVGAVVIEDVAQSMGAAYGGRKAGSHGDFGLFSLGPGKPLSAGGGGIVTVNRADDEARIVRAWSRLPDSTRVASWQALGRLALFSRAFEPHGWWLATKAGAQKAGDSEENRGFRLRGLTAAQSAVAGELLPRLQAFNATRGRNARALLDALGDCPGITVPLSRAPQAESIYLRLPLIFDSPAACDAVHRALQDAGIGAGRMYKEPLSTLFPELVDMQATEADMPGARRVADSLLTLPTHHYLTANDIARMAGIIQAEMARPVSPTA